MNYLLQHTFAINVNKACTKNIVLLREYVHMLNAPHVRVLLLCILYTQEIIALNASSTKYTTFQAIKLKS